MPPISSSARYDVPRAESLTATSSVAICLPFENIFRHRDDSFNSTGPRPLGREARLALDGIAYVRSCLSACFAGSALCLALSSLTWNCSFDYTAGMVSADS
jgi:hypothetical protein